MCVCVVCVWLSVDFGWCDARFLCIYPHSLLSLFRAIRIYICIIRLILFQVLLYKSIYACAHTFDRIARQRRKCTHWHNAKACQPNECSLYTFLSFARHLILTMVRTVSYRRLIIMRFFQFCRFKWNWKRKLAHTKTMYHKYKRILRLKNINVIIIIIIIILFGLSRYRYEISIPLYGFVCAMVFLYASRSFGSLFFPLLHPIIEI